MGTSSLPALEGIQIGFGKACLVELVNMVIDFVPGVIIVFIVMMVFGVALLHGMH